MSAVAAKPAAGGAMNPTAMAVGVVMLSSSSASATSSHRVAGLMALIGIIVGGVLIGFGTHFVPVGGAPAAMGQAPGIATGVAMLAAGAGLAGLFGGAWAAEQGTVIAVVTGGVGGGLMMAITCMMVNFVYVFGMGIPAASGKVAKDPITGDTQAEYKSQGTEGHGLPFVSFVGGVTGGILGGAGGTLIYIDASRPLQGNTSGCHEGDRCTGHADCSLCCRYICRRYVPRECSADCIQHHGNDRRTPRPEVQALATGNRCIRGRIGTLRSCCDSDRRSVRCENVSKS